MSRTYLFYSLLYEFATLTVFCIPANNFYRGRRKTFATSQSKTFATSRTKLLQPLRASSKMLHIFELCALAKEIFKNEYAHASMAHPFYENCLGSEWLQIASYINVHRFPSLPEVLHVFLLLRFLLPKALKSFLRF